MQTVENLPSWLSMPETLDQEAYAPLEADMLDTTLKHVSWLMAVSQKATEVFIEWRSEGLYVYDPVGVRYFDCLGAGGVFGLGFRHPRVVAAVKAQIDRGPLSTRAGIVPAQAELAKRLIEIAPGNFRHVFFGNSGTESVEAAMKLARLATGRPGLVGTHMGYHGMSLGTISVSGLGAWRQGVEPPVEGTHLVQHGNIDELRQVVNESTAAVVMEPIQWASGCKVADKDYFKQVKAHCESVGALLILDEIQTGLGRTGTWFAAEHWGVEPDLLCVGKVLSGGVVPVSATLFNERIHMAERMRALFNNSSFGGNPLACAAGVATIDVLKEGLLDQAKALGDQVGEGFDALVKEFPDILVGHHGLGLMRCLEFAQPLNGALFSQDMRTDEHIITASMSHIPQFVRVSPPYIAESKDIDELLAACKRVMLRHRELGPQALGAKLQALIAKVQEMAAQGG